MTTVGTRCVLFDLDGTLVDTAPDLGDAANHVRRQLGLPPLPDADYRPIASAGARGLLRRALDIGEEHVDYARHRQTLLDYYQDHIADRSRPFAGIDALLARIVDAGLQWGVVTNKPGWLTRPLLARLDLPTADTVVCADDVARPKPAPDSLQRASELLGTPCKFCLYVGDDERDIVAGNAAGMQTLAAAWGYLGIDARIENWGAHRIVTTPAEILPA